MLPAPIPLKVVMDTAKFFSQWHQLCRLTVHPAEPIVYVLDSMGTVAVKCERCGETKILADRRGDTRQPKWSVK